MDNAEYSGNGGDGSQENADSLPVAIRSKEGYPGISSEPVYVELMDARSDERVRATLHGVITADHRFAGKELESVMQRTGEMHLYFGRNGSGIVSLHRGTNSSHLHWIHFCTNYHKGDCKCRTTSGIRSKGFSIRWQRHPVYDGWLINIMSYLFEPGRTALQVAVAGKDKLGEWIQAKSKGYELGKRQTYGYLRCNLDRGTLGREFEESSSNPEEGDKRENYPEGSTGGSTRDKAKQLWELLGRSFPGSLPALLKNPEYSVIFSEWNYVKELDKKNLTQTVYENFNLAWTCKSFQEIILARLGSQCTERVYYTPKSSADALYYLLRHQLGKDENIKQFINDLIDIVDKNRPKVNCFYLEGEVSSGKTWLINSLRDLIWSVGDVIAKINRTSTFPFENLLYKRMGIINEMNCHPDQVNLLKGLFEGDKIVIDVKYKNKMELERTPMIVTTNDDFFLNLDYMSSQALRDRMIIPPKWRPSPFLKPLLGKPHPLAWAILHNWVVNDGPPPTCTLTTLELDTTCQSSFINQESYQDKIKHLYY